MNISGKGPLTLVNSTENPLWGLKLYGRSVQNGTPKPDAPITIVTIPNTINVTVTKNDDPTQTQTLNIPVPVYRKNLCSTNNLTFETSEQIKFAVNIPAGDYIISANIESTDTDSTANLALFYYADGTTKEVYLTRGSGRVFKTFTLTKEATRVRLYASEGHSLSSGDTATWSDIQIEAGSEMTPFDSYITESYGLPGVPVSSDGTYTDENGQQWCADEIDFGSGKHIQRIGRIILANDYNLQENPYIYGGDTIGAIWHNLIPEDYDAPPGLCEYAPVGDYMPGGIDAPFIWVGSVGLDLVFWIDVIRYLGFSTVDEFKTWLGDKKIPVFYKLNTPIEHDLPQELMDAYAELATYDDTTVVDNDQDAWMDVAYADSGSEDLTEMAELCLYFAAMAHAIPLAICPDPTCRLTHLLRRYLDPDYQIPFIWVDESAYAERYALDLIYGTPQMLSHIPKSDMEKYFHCMIGGTVDEMPDPNASVLNYWMNEALEVIQG